LRDGVIAAVESINAAPDYMLGKKWIGENLRIDPGRLADSSIPIKQIA